MSAMSFCRLFYTPLNNTKSFECKEFFLRLFYPQNYLRYTKAIGTYQHWNCPFFAKICNKVVSREGRRKFCNLILFVFSVLRQLYRMDGVFERRVKPLNSNEVAVSRNDFIVYLLYPIFSAFHSWWTRTIFIERTTTVRNVSWLIWTKSGWKFWRCFRFRKSMLIIFMLVVEWASTWIFFLEINFQCN